MPSKHGMNRYDEDKLILRLKRGDEEAFNTLFSEYKGMIFSIAYGITLDHEESFDIVQEVFIKVYENIPRFQGKSKLSTWLHRITVNHCLNWQRKWKRRFRWHHHSIDSTDGLDNSALGSESFSPEAIYREKEMGRILQESLKKIPEDARAVFILKEFQGLSYDEIAEVMKIKRGTVSSRLYYVRKKLDKSIKKYMDNDKEKQ